MTDTVIPYRFLVRGGTAAAVAGLNEVPKARELVFETDTLKFKLGNGATNYNTLTYAVSDVTITLSDVTTGNASTLRHGFLPKLSGNVNEFLNGAGAFAEPAGGGGGTALGLLTQMPGISLFL